MSESSLSRAHRCLSAGLEPRQFHAFSRTNLMMNTGEIVEVRKRFDQLKLYQIGSRFQTCANVITKDNLSKCIYMLHIYIMGKKTPLKLASKGRNTYSTSIRIRIPVYI
jgi:hypothetical protein